MEQAMDLQSHSRVKVKIVALNMYCVLLALK